MLSNSASLGDRQIWISVGDRALLQSKLGLAATGAGAAGAVDAVAVFGEKFSQSGREITAPLRVVRAWLAALRINGAYRQVPIRVPIVQVEHPAPRFGAVPDQRVVRDPAAQEPVVPPLIRGCETLIGQQHLQDRPSEFRVVRSVHDPGARQPEHLWRRIRRRIGSEGVIECCRPCRPAQPPRRR